MSHKNLCWQPKSWRKNLRVEKILCWKNNWELIFLLPQHQQNRHFRSHFCFFFPISQQFRNFLSPNEWRESQNCLFQEMRLCDCKDDTKWGRLHRYYRFRLVVTTVFVAVTTVFAHRYYRFRTSLPKKQPICANERCCFLIFISS